MDENQPQSGRFSSISWTIFTDLENSQVGRGGFTAGRAWSLTPAFSRFVVMKRPERP